mgnify:CR=1 FL=1
MKLVSNMNALMLALGVLSNDVNGKAMIGTNAGGWMVLEPWITPSLFYQFLDLGKDKAA